MQRLCRAVVCIAAALALSAVSASAQTFNFRSTGFVTPAAINQSGAIAGYFCCAYSIGFDGPQPEFHAFSLQSGGQAFKIAEPVGAQNSLATGISPHGDLVGGFCNADCAQGVAMHGYLFSSSSNAAQQIDVPGAVATLAGGINRAGQIVGMSCSTPACGLNYPSESHGFLLDHIGGTFSPIDFPNVLGTAATAINDAGEIVGNYLSCKTPGRGSSSPCLYAQGHGFYLTGGTFTSLDPPGSISTSVTGINNSGEIVGTYLDGSNKTHGFVFNAGVFTDVDFPAAAITVVNGVNDRGEIVGYAQKGSAIENFIGRPQ